MLSTHKSTNDRFEVVSDQQRKLAHQLAQGVTDAAMAATAGVQLGVVYDTVKELMRSLNIGGREYDERRAALVMLCQDFFNIKPGSVQQPREEPSDTEEAQEPAPRILPVLPARSHEEPQTISGNNAEPKETNPVREPVELPSVEDMGARIKALPHKRRIRLEKVITARRGELPAIAKAFGIDPKSLSVSMGSIYKQLGVTGHPDHKAYLARVLAHIRGEASRAQRTTDSAKMPTASAKETPQESASAPVVVRVREVPASLAPTVLPEATEEPEPEPTPVASETNSHGKPNGFGGGVVIPIPSDVTNVDILSGEFRGREASREFVEGFRRKRAQGLRPAFVVLHPSGDDPSTTRANVVFVERGNESK